ncbi:MAG: MoxR family ATPase [Planctomycetes bacterium]|nr:MoxR family ATPase [Planctomycetota bacterium]
MPEGFARRLSENIGRAVLGKADAIELTIVTLIASGHLLIEDRPGVGKTLLASALARSLSLPFQRVQCTSDLLPADILGAEIYQPTTGELTFRPGPVFTSVLVADELNRTPPRTQSALLQCMAEGTVSVDRETRELPEPFFVIATQNPSRSAGTYPLPESQLDRFLMRISLGAPDAETERAIVARGDGHRGLAALEPVASADDVLAAQRAAREVHVEPEIDAYIVELARHTREHSDLRSGVSTRGAQALHRAAQARAWFHGRDYVVPDDVRRLLPPVFGHRIGMRGDLPTIQATLEEMLAAVGAPD